MSVMPTATQGDIRRRRLRVEEIDLDPENPRLVVSTGVSQDELLTYLYEQEALDELVASFVENGYFEEEPLVVVAVDGRHKTVEGNRRLATLKLLLDEGLRRRLRVAGWPTLTDAQKARLETVPCVIYPTRENVLPYLGYRHITGAKK